MQRLANDLKDAVNNFIEAFAISAVMVVLIFWFIGQPLEISGESMLPTFEDGEHTVANKLAYKLKDPEKGEIAIIKHPESKGMYVIKRIIANPGDTFMIKDGDVYINEEILEEPYLLEKSVTFGKNTINEGDEVILGKDEYIMLGDNRENSFDSRNWGKISREDIIGLSSVVYYPLAKIRIVQQH